MDWFVIQAYSGYEVKVKAALEEKIELEGLGDKFGEILVPTEQIVELKSGTKKTTERKFFPGYVLIQMELEDDTWQLVKQTPRVSGFVGGTKEKPVGTVWIAVAGPEGVVSKKFTFGNSRERNIIISSLSALNMLRIELLK